MKLHRYPVTWVVVALALLVPVGVLVARDDGDGASDGSATDGDDGAVLPLLGTEGDVPGRPALAVKVDNTGRGRPQSGLVRADVVFEELVEGGLTRLLAVYHSQDPDTVGPVRSARSTDIALLGELGRPLFAWSGANPTFAAAVRDAEIVDVGVAAVPDGYERVDDRAAPYDLYAAPDELRAAAHDSGAAADPPPVLFTYRPEGAGLDVPDAEPAGGYATDGTGELTTTVRWDWDDETASWSRSQDGTPHVDDEGSQVTAANVVVRFTPYHDSGVRDSTGAVVPEADAVGEGDAWLLTDGQLQRGRWSKPTADAPTGYTDLDGEPLALTPGPTWIEVLPPGTGKVVPAGDDA